MKLKKRNICNLLLVFGYYILLILMFEKVNSIKLLTTLSINTLLIIPLLGMSKRDNRLNLYKILDTIIVVIILLVIFIILGLFIDLDKFILINNYVLYCLTLSLGIFPIILIIKKMRNIKKKIFDFFVYTFSVLFLILNLLSVYILDVFNISFDYLLISFYLIQIISFILSILFVYIFRENKKSFHLNKKELKQYKINLGDIDSKLYFYIINIFNFYCSILLVYYILMSKYYYSFDQISLLYKECYINSLTIIILVSYMVYYIFIKNNNKSIESQILNIFKICLPISIFISILSKPLFILIYNNKNSYFLMFMIWFILIISLYILLIKYAISKINIKLINKLILLGVFFKVIIVYPLINAVYRMGYNLIYGDILANMFSYGLVIMLLFLILQKKKLICFSKYFDSLLKVFYNNIIYSLVLILLTLFVSINTKTRLYSGIVILVYLFISMLFVFGKRILNGGKNEKRN